jgi:hypothetical protein
VPQEPPPPPRRRAQQQQQQQEQQEQPQNQGPPAEVISILSTSADDSGPAAAPAPAGVADAATPASKRRRGPLPLPRASPAVAAAYEGAARAGQGGGLVPASLLDLFRFAGAGDDRKPERGGAGGSQGGAAAEDAGADGANAREAAAGWGPSVPGEPTRGSGQQQCETESCKEGGDPDDSGVAAAAPRRKGRKAARTVDPPVALPAESGGTDTGDAAIQGSPRPQRPRGRGIAWQGSRPRRPAGWR